MTAVVVGLVTVTVADAHAGGTALVTGNGSASTLYTDASGETAAGNNHVTVASDGAVAFYAAPGLYDVSVPMSGGGTNLVRGVHVRAPSLPHLPSVFDTSGWPPTDGDVFTYDAATGRMEPAAETGVALPAQGGNAGKVLSTDGATAEWIPNAASGAAQWVEYDISTDAADWGSPTGGTWDFGIAVTGVIQTTDPETVGAVTYSTPIPGTAFIVQAEVNIPTGQTSVSVPGDITVAAGSQDDGGASDGFGVGCDDVGDGQPIHVNVRVGAHSNDTATATEIVQDEWHRVTAHVSGSTRGSVYVDGVYVTSHLDNASYSIVDKLIISVLGLAKVRNIKVWAFQPTAP